MAKLRAVVNLLRDFVSFFLIAVKKSNWSLLIILSEAFTRLLPLNLLRGGSSDILQKIIFFYKPKK
ncbi:Protein of unknown function [Cotesia congregata]|uniref:Uncharacterized protein n=1 Tax=Cotesia congregata TaxID=51543 RepID=A0A8J2HF63_COTCN|nr:Protein of unknown function [Cotesia congregata]